MGVDGTVELLRRWGRGDRNALSALVEENFEWVEQRVRARLGERLRRIGETGDFVQEAMLDFLKYSPRFEVASQGQFRALLARVIESAITDQNDYWFRARRRAISRERPIPSDTVVDLAPGQRVLTPPDQGAARNETSALLRLAVEMLDPKDRHVLVLRHWEGNEFAEIGERLELTPDGARKRYERALPRLRDALERLRAGRLEP